MNCIAKELGHLILFFFFFELNYGEAWLSFNEKNGHSSMSNCGDL